MRDKDILQRSSVGSLDHFRSSVWILSLVSLFLSPLLRTNMADSDEEYVGEVTEDEDDLQVTRGDNPRAKRKQRGGAEWELSRTWETLVEGADGTINSTVEGLLEAGKRKRSVSSPYSVHIFLLKCISVVQALERYDTTTARYHSTSHPNPGSFAIHVREGLATHKILVDSPICPGIRERIF